MGLNSKQLKAFPLEPKKLKKQSDIKTDRDGLWKYPFENVRVPGQDITMSHVPYPVLGVGSDGSQQMMYPGNDYTFPTSEYVTEFPQLKRGGSTKHSLKQFTDKNIQSSINRLMLRNFTLFGPGGKHVFTPHMQEGGPTAQDSLNLYTNALELKKYYDGLSNYYKTPTVDQDISYFLKDIESGQIERENYLHRDLSPTNKEIIRNNKNKKNIQYFSDLITPAIDSRAPLLRYDNRIKPDGIINYSPKRPLEDFLKSMNVDYDKLFKMEDYIQDPSQHEEFKSMVENFSKRTGMPLSALISLGKQESNISNHLPGNQTTIPYYDPNEVMPYHLRNQQNKIEFNKKHHSTSLPVSNSSQVSPKNQNKKQNITKISEPALEPSKIISTQDSLQSLVPIPKTDTSPYYHLEHIPFPITGQGTDLHYFIDSNNNKKLMTPGEWSRESSYGNYPVKKDGGQTGGWLDKYQEGGTLPKSDATHYVPTSQLDYEQHLQRHNDSLNIYDTQNRFNSEYLSHFKNFETPENNTPVDIIESLKKGWSNRNQIKNGLIDFIENGAKSKSDVRVTKPSDSRYIAKVKYNNGLQIKPGYFTTNSEANTSNIMDSIFEDDTKNAEHGIEKNKNNNIEYVNDYSIYTRKPIFGDTETVKTYGYTHKNILNDKIKPAGILKFHSEIPTPTWSGADSIDPTSYGYNDANQVNVDLQYYNKPIQQVLPYQPKPQVKVDVVKPKPVSNIVKSIEQKPIPSVAETVKQPVIPTSVVSKQPNTPHYRVQQANWHGDPFYWFVDSNGRQQEMTKQAFELESKNGKYPVKEYQVGGGTPYNPSETTNQPLSKIPFQNQIDKAHTAAVEGSTESAYLDWQEKQDWIKAHPQYGAQTEQAYDYVKNKMDNPWTTNPAGNLSSYLTRLRPMSKEEVEYTAPFNPMSNLFDYSAGITGDALTNEIAGKAIGNLVGNISEAVKPIVQNTFNTAQDFLGGLRTPNIHELIKKEVPNYNTSIDETRAISKLVNTVKDGKLSDAKKLSIYLKSNLTDDKLVKITGKTKQQIQEEFSQLSEAEQKRAMSNKDFYEHHTDQDITDLNDFNDWENQQIRMQENSSRRQGIHNILSNFENPYRLADPPNEVNISNTLGTTNYDRAREIINRFSQPSPEQEHFIRNNNIRSDYDVDFNRLGINQQEIDNFIDNGHGIPPALMDNIIAEFRRSGLRYHSQGINSSSTAYKTGKDIRKFFKPEDNRFIPSTEKRADKDLLNFLNKQPGQSTTDINNKIYHAIRKLNHPDTPKGFYNASFSLSDNSAPLYYSELSHMSKNPNIQIHFGGYDNLNGSGNLAELKVSPKQITDFINSKLNSIDMAGKKVPQAYIESLNTGPAGVKSGNIKIPKLLVEKKKYGGQTNNWLDKYK